MILWENTVLIYENFARKSMKNLFDKKAGKKKPRIFLFDFYLKSVYVMSAFLKIPVIFVLMP